MEELVSIITEYHIIIRFVQLKQASCTIYNLKCQKGQQIHRNIGLSSKKHNKENIKTCF